MSKSVRKPLYVNINIKNGNTKEDNKRAGEIDDTKAGGKTTIRGTRNKNTGHSGLTFISEVTGHHYIDIVTNGGTEASWVTLEIQQVNAVVRAGRKFCFKKRQRLRLFLGSLTGYWTSDCASPLLTRV